MVVGDGEVVNGAEGTSAAPGVCGVVEGVSVDEVVVVAWFVPVEGGLEEIVLAGGEGGEEGAVVETEDIEAVSLESCPDDSSRFVPNVSNGVWYSWSLCPTEYGEIAFMELGYEVKLEPLTA